MSITSESDPFGMNESARNQLLLKTRSRMRVWWLCNVQGCRVVLITRLPTPTFWGGVHSARTWWLAERDGKNRNGNSSR